MSFKAPRSLLLVFVVAGLASCSDQVGQRYTYVLSTGNTGGTFYPVGVALSTLVTAEPESEFSLTAISSAGSMENIKLLRDNQAQFALVLGIFAAWAWDGVSPIRNPQPHLRSISAMWPNVEHFVLTSDLVTTGTVSDLGNLNGERYVLGARNSGAEHTGIYILESLGVDYLEKFNLGYMTYGASAAAIQDGNIVGMNVPAGAPVTAITQAYAQMGNDMTVLNFSAREIAAINERYPLWRAHELAPETYPYQVEPITTAASPNVLIVRNDVPEEIVYQLTQLMWENLAALQQIHSATLAMAIEEALEGIPVPLHAGALRYYREQGIAIPERLILEEPSSVNGIDRLTTQ
ncbi:MAG: TAXI family TRAP transporter solute-binding subunit [Pseudomonadales bacterium]|nr:TAXI family TRAP transporter solute-binding subunit [Pseudomonadales bacterium]